MHQSKFKPSFYFSNNYFPSPSSRTDPKLLGTSTFYLSFSSKSGSYNSIIYYIKFKTRRKIIFTLGFYLSYLYRFLFYLVLG